MDFLFFCRIVKFYIHGVELTNHAGLLLLMLLMNRRIFPKAMRSFFDYPLSVDIYYARYTVAVMIRHVITYGF